jgi:outer membrane cobalamin receptor
MLFRRLFTVVFFSVSALAANLKVRVVDPQSAAVSGAQVELFAGNSTRPLAMQTTSAQGIAYFPDARSGSASASQSVRVSLRLRVLAPGFAEEWQTITASGSHSEISVSLRLAVASETVVVSATRNPAPSDESGAAIEALSGAELDTMRPVAASDALRFLPGAIVATAGQRGGLASLFVRGGDSRYNKVIVDSVPVNDPGGTFDFGTLPLFEEDRMEFLRGAQSTLYGSDAMSSVVQVWSRNGNTRVPELRFGADAGNYGTENGYASLAGANGRFDYNVFGNQFNTSGSGPNDDYSNSLEGANLGAKLNNWASLRLRARHDNSVNGVPGAWNYNGSNILDDINGIPTTLLPDLDQRARRNTFLGSLELELTGPSRWQHRLTGYDYTLRRSNTDFISQPGRVDAFGDNLDTPFDAITNVNRAGLNYQGTYAERSWAATTFGYEFEDETGTVGDVLSNTLSPGLRRNHAVFGDQTLSWGRASLVAGGRFVHNESFGNKFVPRVGVTLLALKGNGVFSGTRLHFSYSTGIKEPSFSESSGNGGGFPIIANPTLHPEETRGFDTGFEQGFLSRYSFSATYFNNLFRNKIDLNVDPCFCQGQYVNVNEALAHGAEIAFRGRPSSHVSFTTSYTYTSTQILKEPFAFDPLLSVGQPLIRRPRHSATAMVSYLGSRWGSDLTGSFMGRRADSDFLGFNINHAPGYVLVNAGGWYAIRPRVSLYLNAENILNRSYNEVTGYPALGINFRAGMRFRVGGE